MDREQFEAVARRFDFAAWRGISRLDGEFTVRNISLPKELITGLDPARIREIDPGNGNRLLRMSWQVPGQERALVAMDILECESRDAAHLALLELLANMQAPEIGRLQRDAPGDIAFAHDATVAVAFARGNIVVNVRNGGEAVVPAIEIAKTLDNWIVSHHR